MSVPHTIIIADPDPLFRNVLRVELSELDFAVLLAGDAPEAIDFAMQTCASLVVLDVGPAGLASYEACARIRRQEGYEATPIVLTARDLSPRIEIAANTAGATAILGKPYAFNGLLSTIAPHLAPDHPLMTARNRPAGMGEVTGLAWGKQTPLAWRFGLDSGLSRNAGVLPIVRGRSVRIPLITKEQQRRAGKIS